MAGPSQANVLAASPATTGSFLLVSVGENVPAPGKAAARTGSGGTCVGDVKDVVREARLLAELLEGDIVPSYGVVHGSALVPVPPVSRP